MTRGNAAAIARAARSNAPPIQSQIMQQTDRLLRRGQAGPQNFNQIRQRHIWNTFYFTSGYTGSVILAGTGGLTLTQGDYQFFSVLAGSNGQGLPQGFVISDLDTNFPSAGRVSDDQNFAIYELGLTFEPMRADVAAGAPNAMTPGPIHPTDLDQLTQNAVISIKYLTNEIILGLAKDFVQSGGPAIVAPSLLDYAARGGTEVAGAGPAGVTGGLQEGAVLAGAQVAPWSVRQARYSQNSGPLPAAPGWRRVFKIPLYLPSTAVFFFKISFPRAVQLMTVQQGGTGGFRARIDWFCAESFREQG